MALSGWLKKTTSKAGTYLGGTTTSEKAAYTSLTPAASSYDESATPTIREQEAALYLHHGSPQPASLGALKWAGCVTVALLTAWAFISSIALFGVSPVRDPQSLSCSCGGSTVAEALSRGCIFTELAIAWLPPHCIDFELAEEFGRSGPGPEGEWEYWADANRTVPLSNAELAMLGENDGLFWTTQDWHITHCTFNWRKQYRQRQTGVTMERRSSGLEHIDHCESIFRVRAGLNDIATVSGVALNADEAGEAPTEDLPQSPT